MLRFLGFGGKKKKVSHVTVSGVWVWEGRKGVTCYGFWCLGREAGKGVTCYGFWGLEGGGERCHMLRFLRLGGKGKWCYYLNFVNHVLIHCFVCVALVSLRCFVGLGGLEKRCHMLRGVTCYG